MRFAVGVALVCAVLAPASAWAASKTDYCDQKLSDNGRFEVVCDTGSGPEVQKRWLGTFAPDTIAKARAGDTKEMNKVGQFYQLFRSDYPAAIAWFRKSVDAGDTDGMTYLGYVYTSGYPGAPTDGAEGLKWFKMAADKGNAHAMFWAGDDNETLLHNPAEAERWFRMAGTHGDLMAMQRLVYLYANGAHGFPKDPVQTAQWHLAAANAGDPTALYQVGSDYENGTGVAQSDATAVAWYQKGVKVNEANSERAMAKMYRAGRGIAKNDAQADRLDTMAMRLAPPALAPSSPR